MAILDELTAQKRANNDKKETNNEIIQKAEERIKELDERSVKTVENLLISTGKGQINAMLEVGHKVDILHEDMRDYKNGMRKYEKNMQSCDEKLREIIHILDSNINLDGYREEKKKEIVETAQAKADAILAKAEDAAREASKDLKQKQKELQELKKEIARAEKEMKASGIKQFKRNIMSIFWIIVIFAIAMGLNYGFMKLLSLTSWHWFFRGLLMILSAVVTGISVLIKLTDN